MTTTRPAHRRRRRGLAARGPARRRPGCWSRSRAPPRWTSARRCTSTTRAGSRARSPAAASRARSPRRRWRCSSADGRAAARHLRHLRRAGRHGRADVRRDRPHLHPRARGRARARRCCATSRRRSSTRPAALVTLIDGEQAGAKLFVDAERRDRHRSACGELLDKQRRARGPAACWPRAARRCATSATDGASLGSGLRVYDSIQAEPPRMVVFGAIDFSSRARAAGQGPRLPRDDRRPALAPS